MRFLIDITQKIEKQCVLAAGLFGAFLYKKIIKRPAFIAEFPWHECLRGKNKTDKSRFNFWRTQLLINNK